MRGGWIALLLMVGCRDVLGIEELARGAPDAAADAPDARACGENAAVGACHGCLETSCCKEIEACNDDETCRRSLECILKCSPGDESCAARCTVKFGVQLGDVLSCRARSCADPCATSCGGALGPALRRRLADKPKCAECLKAKGCAQATACAVESKCLQSMACPQSCPLLDRSCNSKCRYPLGPQPDVDALQSAGAECRTECGEGTDWTCVDVSKYSVGSAAGEEPFRLTLLNATDPTQKMAGVTLEPCLDPECVAKAGRKCTSDATGYCDGTVLLTSPGPVFRGIVRASGAGVVPTLYFVHPLLAGGWAGGPEFAPQTALVVPESSLAIAFAIAGVTQIPGRGHVAVGVFDCSWQTAEGVTVSLSPSDDKVAIRYLAGSLPSPDAKATDVGGTAYVFNVLPSASQYLLTVKSGERVVAETRVFVRADTMTFGLLGPR